jgi:hypothetical protein
MLLPMFLNAQSYLNVHYTDGSNQHKLLSSIRKITFNLSSQQINFFLADTGLITKNLASIQKFTFDTSGLGTLLPVGKEASTPKNFELSQNYPNPFNPTTTIGFKMPTSGFVSLKVYDITGNEIATLINQEKPAGDYKVQFNTHSIASGVYFYRLSTGGVSLYKKMIVIK